MEVSSRFNEGKIDFTNLSINAFIPFQDQESRFIKKVLEDIDNAQYAIALESFAIRYRDCIQEAAYIMKAGEPIYGRDNWQKGMTKQSICASLRRHIQSYYNEGIAKDAKSGFSHIGHIYCNLMFLDYHSTKGFLD